jgi:hypothetical protein
VLAGERASKEHPRGREVRGGAPGEDRGEAVRTCWLFWLLGLSRAPPGPRAAMRAGLVGPVGRLRGGALSAAGIAGMVRCSRGGAVELCAGCCAGGWEEERGERG